MLKSSLLWAARNQRMRHLVENSALARPVVGRFIPGRTQEQAIEAVQTLLKDGLFVTLDYLGEDTTDIDSAQVTVDAYLNLLKALKDLNVDDRAEVSIKLSAIGQALPQDGAKISTENAFTICQAAHEIGSAVTFDMEDHTTVDTTLETVRTIRKDFPTAGAVLQAYLHRTEADCKDLATEGSRIRLCKGAYKETASVAYQKKREVDASYLRCLNILMGGKGYPMVASHDPQIIEATNRLAATHHRDASTYEHQMLFGIRPCEQTRLAAEGKSMRIYLPFGDEWYGYFMRRLAERPANLTFFLRSLFSKK